MTWRLPLALFNEAVGLGEFELGFAGKVFEEGFKGGQRRVTNSRARSGHR